MEVADTVAVRIHKRTHHHFVENSPAIPLWVVLQTRLAKRHSETHPFLKNNRDCGVVTSRPEKPRGLDDPDYLGVGDIPEAHRRDREHGLCRPRGSPQRLEAKEIFIHDRGERCRVAKRWNPAN